MYTPVFSPPRGKGPRTKRQRRAREAALGYRAAPIRRAPVDAPATTTRVADLLGVLGRVNGPRTAAQHPRPLPAPGAARSPNPQRRGAHAVKERPPPG